MPLWLFYAAVLALSRGPQLGSYVGYAAWVLGMIVSGLVLLANCRYAILEGPEILGIDKCHGVVNVSWDIWTEMGLDCKKLHESRNRS